MAINAVDEALRNLTAVGGDIERAFILDNFCWGNPTDPLQLGMLVRAVKGCHDAAIGYGTPFISGKDSLNNEYRSNGERVPVIPTLLISAVGVIDDAAQTIDMSLKQPGNLLYQIGITRNELAGSHYAEILGELQAPTIQETDEAETEYSRGVPLRSPWGGVGMPTHSPLGGMECHRDRLWIGLGHPIPYKYNSAPCRYQNCPYYNESPGFSHTHGPYTILP